MTPIENKKNVQDQDSTYYMRYRDYFETAGVFNNYYRYNVDLVNINDNQTWPLGKCPKCKCDLQANQPVIKYFKYTSNAWLIATIAGGIIAIGILSKFLLGLFLLISDTLALIASIFILIFMAIFIFAGRKGNKIKLFYCPECNSLLFNEKLTHPLYTKMHPNIFFKELEKFGEFRFKA